MSLILDNPTCAPDTLTPKGGPVKFHYFGNATNNTPSHMQARFSINKDEPYRFTKPGGTTRHVFSSRSKAPASSKRFGPTSATIVPQGAVETGRSVPLKVTVTLQGFDSAGNQIADEVDTRVIEISMDPVSMALLQHDDQDQSSLAGMDPVTAAVRLVITSLGIEKTKFSEVLGVSTSTVDRVMRGENSPKLRQALNRIFKGEKA